MAQPFRGGYDFVKDPVSFRKGSAYLYMPYLIIAIGALGLCLCGFLVYLARESGKGAREIKKSPINQNVDLKKYFPTPHPEIFIDRELPDHPFRLVKNGIFCGVCLITSEFKHSDNPSLVHTHYCTVIRKEWKIMICKDAILSEYYISLGKAHFKRG